MKKIDDYTQQEIIKLTQDEINTIIKIHLAEDGVKIVEAPVKPVLKPVAEADITIYQINNLELYFTDRALAETIADLFSKNIKFLHKTNYNYSNGSEHKYLTKITSNYGWDTDGVSIKQQKVYSKSLYQSIELILAENNIELELYQSKNREYEKYLDALKKQTKYVLEKVRVAVSFEKEKDSKLKIFQDYLKLADNNREIAWKFMKKAYTLTDDEEKYILENAFKQPIGVALTNFLGSDDK